MALAMVASLRIRKKNQWGSADNGRSSKRAIHALVMQKHDIVRLIDILATLSLNSLTELNFSLIA
jgi:hypothetical protein